jgi:hypothetical protein
MNNIDRRASNRASIVTAVLTICLLTIFCGQAQRVVAQSQWTNVPNSPNIYKTDPNGNVGIGTTTPESLLHLAGPNGVSAITLNTPGAHKFRFQTLPGLPNVGLLTINANYIYPNGWYLDDTTVNGWFFKLDTRNYSPVFNGLWLYRVPAGQNPHGDEVPAFGVSSNLAYFSGSVGIGNLSPNYNLDVSGTAHVTSSLTVDGNIAAKYQDVAEWVPATHCLSAGTVVVLNPEKSNQVMASSSAYDTGVAGVVSGRPGLALGEAGQDKVLVATTGRVKVKVDASRSPIRVGDLLVTSDQEGVAMKSEPVELNGIKLHRPGTLLGKALEPLETGTGEILVLLSLQ